MHLTLVLPRHTIPAYATFPSLNLQLSAPFSCLDASDFLHIFVRRPSRAARRSRQNIQNIASRLPLIDLVTVVSAVDILVVGT